MPALTNYTKSTEAYILSNPPSDDGQMAYAIDTQKLFISDSTNWIEWKASGNYSPYIIDGHTYKQPICHLDASVASSMTNNNGEAMSHGDTVASLQSLTGDKEFTAHSALGQPIYLSNNSTPPHGESSGDGRINGLGTLQFQGQQSLAYDYLRNKTHIIDEHSFFIVCRCPSLETFSSNGSYNPLFGSVYGGINFTPRRNSSTSYIYTYGFSNGSILSGTAMPELTNGTFIFYFSEARGYADTSTFARRVAVTDSSGQLFSTAYQAVVNNSIMGHGLQLGSTSSHAQFAIGEVGEVLFFDKALKISDVNRLGNYLSSKWALNWTDL